MPVGVDQHSFSVNKEAYYHSLIDERENRVPAVFQIREQYMMELLHFPFAELKWNTRASHGQQRRNGRLISACGNRTSGSFSVLVCTESGQD